MQVSGHNEAPSALPPVKET